MSPSGLSTPRPVPGDVTAERLDGEVIAVHLGTGRYYSMSGPAADVWWLMDQAIPREQWPAILAGSFGADVPEADVSTFVEACVTASLVADGPTRVEGGPTALPDDYARGSWTAPVLEEFDDLQDLILVDPVHDTSALGWPYVADADG